MGVSYFVFNKSEVGRNHIKAEKGCEDWSGLHQDKGINICVVADGHGSDNYPRTDRGSKFAVQAAMNCVKEFLKYVKVEDILGNNQEDLILQLEKSILSTWHMLVEEDFARGGFTKEELEKVSEKYKKRYIEKTHIEKAYGSTLIVFAITEYYSLGIQIGDGSCVILNDKGEFSVPIPEDPDCQLNITTSICDSDAIDEFRYYVSETAPVAVFCGSDGIEDSYSSREELFALYRSISIIFAEHGQEVGENEVVNYLPVLTQKGSGDDVSIAGIINMDSIMSMKVIFETQTNLFKVADKLETKNHRLLFVQERFENLCAKLSDFSNGGKTAELIHKMVDEIAGKKAEIDSLNSEIAVLLVNKEKLEESLRNYYTQPQNVYTVSSKVSTESEKLDSTETDESEIVSEEMKSVFECEAQEQVRLADITNTTTSSNDEILERSCELNGHVESESDEF